MAKKKSFGRMLVYWINVVCALLLVGGYAANYVPATVTPVFSFLGLAYPVLLIINLLFVLFWLLKLDKRILLSVLAIGLGFYHIQRFHKFSGSNKVVNPTSSFKVTTFNVRMFNHYAWLPSGEISEKIGREVSQLKPDILFVQEYYQTEKTPDFNMPHAHAKMTNVGKNYGLAIYSNFPIQQKGIINYSDTGNQENNQFIYADINVNNVTYRCINAHLASVGLGKGDYQRLDHLTEGTQEEIERDFGQMLRRVSNAFKRRVAQTEALEKAIEESPYPVILAGDFNDTPSSYTYKRFDNLLTDSFLEAGKGFSKTYTKTFVPLRIDYIFHGENLRAFNYSVSSKKLSDHYAVSVSLEQVQ